MDARRMRFSRPHYRNSCDREMVRDYTKYEVAVLDQGNYVNLVENECSLICGVPDRDNSENCCRWSDDTQASIVIFNYKLKTFNFSAQDAGIISLISN